MSAPLFELVDLHCGVKTLRQIANQEIFHPEIGPFAEARILHVEQHRLAERCTQPGRFVIWDVGLGAAANALCAIEALKGCVADVEIHSFDITTAPLQFACEHAVELGYLVGYEGVLAQFLAKGHALVNDKLNWHLHLGDFRDAMLHPELPAPHAIFYDPYSQAGNREMWSLEHFKKLRSLFDDSIPCLLTNYTASTVVRVTWLLAGFYVGFGSSAGKKKHTTVASNQLSNLARPLDQEWLERLKNSHSSSPLHDVVAPLAPMTAQEYADLAGHRQFSADTRSAFNAVSCFKNVGHYGQAHEHKSDRHS